MGNLCVVPAGNAGPPNIIVDHLVAIVNGGALPGFINLVRSADIESARLGLQFLELVRESGTSILLMLSFIKSRTD